MRLIFMGTPEFSVATLDALLAAGHEVAAVYTQPPRPAGRGKLLRASPVQLRAEELGLAVRHPASLKGADEQSAFAALGAEAAVVVAYGLILPQTILSAPIRGCFNVHASLLPRWRGAAPIQRAVEAGDAQTGVTIMQMEQGLDTGPMLLKGEITIGRMTAGELHDALAEIGARLMVEALARIDTLTPQQQDDALATHAAKIDKAEARIDWNQAADVLERRIRALAPSPGAWFELGGERIKLLRAELADGGGAPGRVTDDRLTIACGQGALRPEVVQRAGRPAMPLADFLRGHPVAPGTQLG
jgi:methionyl-tRNA formyltransferase